MSKHANKLEIKLVAGRLAPRYSPDVSELQCHNAVVTERGTSSGHPLVDFQLTDEAGNEFFFALTGSIILGLADAIKGVNDRNHGVAKNA